VKKIKTNSIDELRRIKSLFNFWMTKIKLNETELHKFLSKSFLARYTQTRSYSQSNGDDLMLEPAPDNLRGSVSRNKKRKTSEKNETVCMVAW